MNLLQIELSPEGKFRLHWSSHFTDFPCTEKGVELLHHVLFSYAVEAKRIGTNGKPTQSMVDAWLAAFGDGPLQLAGNQKRWEDVEKATGVKVRRLDSKGYEKEPTLEDLGL